MAAVRHSGRVAVVVGGTSGIGRAIAERLSDSDYRVVIVGRDAARGAEIVSSMNERGSKRGGHEFMRCDASRIANIRECAGALRGKLPVVDALVLSQGIATIQGRTETDEGIDVKLALHYFGRVAFAQEMLPSLRAAPSPRVLTVLSAGVHSPYKHYEDDFELRKHYSIKNAADAAGFYTDLAWDSLSRDPANARVTFAHAAPGLVKTSWGTEMPWAIRVAVRGLQQIAAKPASECAEVLSQAALLRERATGGLLLLGERGQEVGRTEAHEAARVPVWRSTLELLGPGSARRRETLAAAAPPPPPDARRRETMVSAPPPPPDARRRETMVTGKPERE